jgi:transcriptional regulator with XRE-family HTH domain
MAWPRGQNNPVDAAVGARIRLLRKRRKKSQEELGKAIGVTFQQVEEYENGKNRVGASRLNMIADALKVPITELFDGTSATSNTTTATKSLAFDSRALRIAEVFVKISDKELRSSLVDLTEAARNLERRGDAILSRQYRNVDRHRLGSQS